MAQTTTSTIETVERRTRPGMMASLVNPAWSSGSPALEGWYAEVTIGETRFEFSKLDGESDWTADAAWGKGSFPIFSHGFGSRCTIPRIADSFLAADLDAAVSAR